MFGSERSFSHFIDILEQISLGVFEIEGVRAEVIKQLKEERREIIKIFGINEKIFNNLIEAKKAVD